MSVQQCVLRLLVYWCPCNSWLFGMQQSTRQPERTNHVPWAGACLQSHDLLRQSYQAIRAGNTEVVTTWADHCKYVHAPLIAYTKVWSNSNSKHGKGEGGLTCWGWPWNLGSTSSLTYRPMASAASGASPFCSTISRRTSSQGSLSSLSIALQHTCCSSHGLLCAQPYLLLHVLVGAGKELTCNLALLASLCWCCMSGEGDGMRVTCTYRLCSAARDGHSDPRQRLHSAGRTANKAATVNIALAGCAYLQMGLNLEGGTPHRSIMASSNRLWFSFTTNSPTSSSSRISTTT